MNVNNPPLFSGLVAIGMNLLMAGAAQGREVGRIAKESSMPSGFVMNVLARLCPATFAHRMKRKVGIAALAVFCVFALSFCRQSPQPCSVLQWLAPTRPLSVLTQGSPSN